MSEKSNARGLGKIEKDKKKKLLLNKYKKIFKNISEDKKSFVEKLYTEAVFMELTLSELQDKINEKGPIITGKNGNGFKVTQENPAVKSYNTMIRNYNIVMKTLLENVPEDMEDDELMIFLKGKPK